MTKFQYAPGLPGYGNQGIDGSIGLPGLAMYFSSFAGGTDQSLIEARILANKTLLSADEFLPGYPARIYQTGDIFIDSTGSAFEIDLELGSPLYATTSETLATSAFFVAQGTTPGTSYTRYANNHTGDRSTVDNVYTVTSPTGYKSRPDTLYLDTANDFPVTNFSNVELSATSTKTYMPFLYFSNGNSNNKEAFGIVWEKDTSIWRFGNRDENNVQRDVHMSFDFTEVNVPDGSIISPHIITDLLVATNIVGDITGEMVLTATTDTTTWPVIAPEATGGTLRTSANFTLDANSGIITSGGLVVQDGTAIGSTGSVTLGTDADAGIWYESGNVLNIATNSTSNGTITIDSEGNSLVVKMSGTMSAIFSPSGLNLQSADTYSINTTEVLSATTLGNGVISSSLQNVGTLTALNVDNININGNTISSSAGDINITPFAGQKVFLDASTSVDFGVVTSTTFVGALTGNASTSAAWATPRTITITGDASGISTGWTGSTDTSISVTIVNAGAATQLYLNNDEDGFPNGGILFSSGAPGNSTVYTDDDEFYYDTGTCFANDFGSASDENLKENMVYYGYVLDRITSIMGSFSTFDWISSGKADVGYSAQVIQKKFPEIVSGEDKLSISYQKIGAIALEGIAELRIEKDDDIFRLRDELTAEKEKNIDLADRLTILEDLLLNK